MPNRMIYIQNKVNDNLKSEENVSGLINELLLEHYAMNSKPIVMPSDKKKETFNKLRSQFDDYHEPVVTPLEGVA